jgi:hypothetical protein
MTRTIHLDHPKLTPITRNVKHPLCFAASVALLAWMSFDSGCCASAQQTSSASIVGRWRSMETSKGGIGYMFEFRSDGTVDFSPAAVVETQWRIENNQLILPPGTVGGAEQKFNLKWLGDNKLSLTTGADVTELARIGDLANPGNPIVGEWIESREMAGRNLEAHWLFYLDGKILFLMPFVTQHGSYTISGSALHLKVPGLGPEFRFELTDGVLTFSAPEGGDAVRYAHY